MPKPGTSNTLLSLPKQQVFNPQQAGMVALPQIGQGLVNSLGTPRPVSQIANFNPGASLASPQMSTVQASGQTAFGTQIPQQQQQSSPQTQQNLAQVQPQHNAIQTSPVQLAGGASNTSPTGNTTALPGQQQGAPQAGAAKAPTTFPGLVGSLSQNSLVGSPLVGTAAQGLMANAQNNPLQSGGAYDAYARATKDLADLKSGIASQFGRMESDAIPLEFTQGREQVLNRQNASLLDAAQQRVNQAQASLGYGIQEQQAQQAGLTSAGNLGNTAQGLLQSGLTSAGQLSQPQLGAFGQGYYSPLSPNSGAGSGQYGTGPAAAANVQSIQDLTSQANNWAASRQAAENISSQLTTFLQGNQVNPADFNAVNRFLQTIGAQTSSPQYKQFYNLITDLANAYAPVLSVSGDATNYKTELAQSLLDGTAAGQTIPQILASLDAQAQAKIHGVLQTRDRLQNGGNINPSSQQYAPTGNSLTWDTI